ncbi:MAG: M15 family metallopeptidase [Saprospiraceae bacterium]|nr:M15 family metallopeptidase [Saprospiraceae bacterium]
MLLIYFRFLFLALFINACDQPKDDKTSAIEIIDTNDDSEQPILDKEIHLDSFDLKYITGRFDPSSHPDFQLIPIKYADREGQYLRKDVLAAFIKMYDSAAKEGIYFKIRSATRNFESQKRIWENKWTGETKLENGLNAAKDIADDVLRAKKILEYSSMPGTSRHHWGTDIDINSFDNKWFEKGEGFKLYNWMTNHAASFGFCQPYTKIGVDRPSGYFEEKWHWTYMPVSSGLTETALKILKDDIITGFKGADTAVNIEVVKNYVLGINKDCR